MIRVFAGDYVISLAQTRQALFDDYEQRASLAVSLVADRGLPHRRESCFLAVRERDSWPFLTVTLTYSPGSETGFRPGVLLAEDTSMLFVGAGGFLLAFDLRQRSQLWQDTADHGFWSWARHGDIVLMSAELELAAWDVRGRKLWSMFVEPPWTYRVEGDTLKLDVMGAQSSFPLREGPPSGNWHNLR